MKLNIGSSKLKKSYFPISFDSSTSSNFGECIPSFCHEVVSDSHVNIDLRSAVRFAPLSLPTFGKAYLHSYAYYHKFSDLWAPYNDFLARTPYSNSTGSSYVPTEVPNVPLSLLWMTVLCHSDFTVWTQSSAVIPPQSSSAPIVVGTYGYTKNSLSSGNKLAPGLVRTLAKWVPGAVGYLSNSPKDFIVYTKDTSVPSRYIPSQNIDLPDLPQPIKPEGADFLLSIKGSDVFYRDSNSSTFTNNSSDTNTYIFAFKLNNSGKLLRKIFLGLGYQLKRVSNQVSLLPLFAFYKSYFSTFAPKRFIKYEQTFFGKVMTVAVNTGDSLMNIFCSLTNPNYVGLYSGMVDDLLSCFYTEDTDYYSSQIIGLVNEYGDDISQPYLAEDSDSNIWKDSISSDVLYNNAPGIDFTGGSATTLHTQSQQNVLSRLTNFVNRRSLLGGKIADLLESVFGIPNKDVLCDDNPYIGSSIIDVEFNDVFSTAETAEASLGEYAGKALGSGFSDKLSVQCSSPGVVLVFSCVVPRTQKVQGVNPSLFHVAPSDYYNPAFDGITLLPTNRLSLYCVDSINDSETQVTTSFGNQSLFAEYKTKTQGVLNGDLSLLSTKSSYDSFTLDQTIANYVSSYETDQAATFISVISPNLSACAAGTMWRYIGRWLWLGNFDRIFVNVRQFLDTWHAAEYTWQERDSHVTDDNLIIHNVVDLRINAPMLPLEDSYMTKDLDELNNDVGVRSQGE